MFLPPVIIGPLFSAHLCESVNNVLSGALRAEPISLKCVPLKGFTALFTDLGFHYTLPHLDRIITSVDNKRQAWLPKTPLGNARLLSLGARVKSGRGKDAQSKTISDRDDFRSGGGHG